MPDELSPESEILPPFAPALIVGAAKGGLAGLLLSAIPLVPMLLAPARGVPDMLLVALGFVFAGAGICGLDAASSRLDAIWKRRACRFLAGAVMPIGAFAPQFGILSKPIWQGVDALMIVLGLGAFGVCLGLGVLAAGEPDTVPHRAQGCGRLSIVAVGAVIAGTVPLALVELLGRSGGGDVCGGVLAMAASALIVAGSFWLAQMLASLLVRPLAVWLDPESMLDEARSLSVASAELKRAEGALRLRRFLTAMAALDVAEADRSSRLLDPGLIPLRRAEVFLAQGELDQAEALAPIAKDAPAILAEVARRRGDPETAARLAQQWLDSVEGLKTVFASSVRASALALIALARADQGRFEEAAVALASGCTVHGIFPHSFDHLTVRRVADHVEACRKRSKPS